MSQHKGEHGTSPTVKIKTHPHQGNEEGVVEINHSDYDPDKHELVSDQKHDEKSEKPSSKKKDR